MSGAKRKVGQRQGFQAEVNGSNLVLVSVVSGVGVVGLLGGRLRRRRAFDADRGLEVVAQELKDLELVLSPGQLFLYLVINEEALKQQQCCQLKCFLYYKVKTSVTVLNLATLLATCDFKCKPIFTALKMPVCKTFIE